MPEMCCICGKNQVSKLCNECVELTNDIPPVDKIVSLRLECETCRSSRAVSIEGDELYCKIHKENRNKFCINWNPSRFSVKAYLSD